MAIIELTVSIAARVAFNQEKVVSRGQVHIETSAVRITSAAAAVPAVIARMAAMGAVDNGKQ